MPYRERFQSSAKGNPKEILAIWRDERATRIGRVLCYSGLILAAVATLVDLFWSDFYVVVTDFLLLLGCAVSLYWIRAKSRPTYYWWPLYWGFWISILPSLWVTGGINSPFFGIDLAALCMIGVVMEGKKRSLVYLVFTFLHIPVFYGIERFYPLSTAASPPVDLTAAITGITLLAVFICLYAFLRTEENLAAEFAAHYQDLEKTEANLKSSETQLREAQSIANIGSWEWDIAADRIVWSDELMRIFGVSKENFDPSYQAYLQRLAPEKRAKIESLVQRSIETGQDYTFEHSVERADGLRHISSRGRVMKDATGKVVKFMGTAQDITERMMIESELLKAQTELERRVEERTQQLAQSLEREKAAKEVAENASMAKMQFLANMSHEIRTPMNSILGFSEILFSEEHSAEKSREYLSRIRTNGKQLLHLIDDILDLSKFEAGRIPFHKSPVLIKDLVNDIAESFMPTLRSKGLELDVKFQGDFSRQVIVDAHRLNQVLINLLGNSIKFSEKGGVRITVTEAIEGESVRLAVDVEDSGIGISPENQRNLFLPFSQADGSIARKFGGSGLGLALSKRIVEAMGGRLELCSSSPDVGSHFRFEIPTTFSATEVAQRTTSTPAKKASDADGLLREKKILLAEDSTDNAVLIAHYVKSLGGNLDIATDGLQAVESAARTKYDCILMDIQMPGMDGLEATRRIREQGFRGPIIALTAHALPSEAARSIDAGCDLHMTKPISKTDLTSTLKEHLKAAKA